MTEPIATVFFFNETKNSDTDLELTFKCDIVRIVI